jgi:FkbM family methyltransferase
MIETSMYFSQFGEDKFLIDHYLCKEGIPKFYIELGALDGVRYSNTKTLQDECGWSGILIEPIPSAFEKLVLNRPGNVLVNSLVGMEGGQEEFRYFSNPDLQCVSAVKSTQRQFHQRQWMDESTAENDWLAGQISTDLQAATLPTRSLASIIQQSGISAFGFLSLDVEGHELEVLKSHDWQIPIAYMLIEGDRDRDRDVVDLVCGKGGRFECAVHINMLFSFVA